MSLNIQRYKSDLDKLCERAMLLRLSMVLDVYGDDGLKKSLNLATAEEVKKAKANLPTLVLLIKNGIRSPSSC